MSSTITYKGNTIATANNNTKILNTAGKYLESDITITDVTTIMNLITKSITANGTYNASSDNADGYSSVTVNVTGGNSGLEYESGTYTPTSDIARPTISFSKTHTSTPIIIAMSDTSSYSTITSSSNTSFVFFDMYRLNGSGYPYSTSAQRYALAIYGYRSSNSSTISSVQISYNSDNTSTSNTSYSRYWVTASDFKPYSNSTSRYWRANRTYKWIAIWKPTT